MKRGFILIVIVVVIIGAIAVLTKPVDGSVYDPRSCSAGYVFVNSGRTQLLDEQGHGIPCEAAK